MNGQRGLKNIVDQAQQHAMKAGSAYLFMISKGERYSSSAFQTYWQRLMKSAIEQGVLQETFHFHDIRRKAATDAEKKYGREHARKMLGHASQKTTAIYISGTQKIRAL